MRCAVCSRDLPVGFPGATLTCSCGASATLPAMSGTAAAVAADAHRPGGPYRSSIAMPSDGLEIRCPYCGNTCLSTLRVCPHCDVRFDSVRCGRCYTLQPPGAFACARCAEPLELEPVLDVTAAPCPRCTKPLEAAGGPGGWEDARLHECPRCGGMFVPREALADILCRAELVGPLPEAKRVPVMPLEQVRYLSCPMCRSSMNRVNFGKVSGVIVDVCRVHGTWFDGGELTRIVAFAAGGGLVRTRARDAQEKREQQDGERQRAVAAQLAIAQTRNRAELDQRLEEWRRFLNALFFW